MANFKATFAQSEGMKATFSSSGTMAADFGSVVKVHSDDYEDIRNKPTINSVEVVGDKVGDDYQLQNKLTAGENITLNGTVISAEFEQDFASYSEVLAYLNS